MAQTWHLKDWFPDADLNNEVSPRGAKEKMDRDQVNDVMREMMGAVNADWLGHSAAGGAWRDPNQGAAVSKGGANQVVIAGIDVRAYFPLNRKVRVQHATGLDVYGFVSVLSFSTNTTVTIENLDDAGTVGATANAIQFSSLFGSSADGQVGRSAYKDTVDFVVPDGNTDVELQAALTTALSENQIVLLKAEEYLLAAGIDLATGSAIWGQKGSSVKLAGGTDEHMFTLANNATDIELRGFKIDGNGSNQTNLGTGIEFGEGNLRVSLSDLQMTDFYTDGINMGAVATSARNVNIRDSSVFNAGRHCINITDPSSPNANGIFLSSLVLKEPGWAPGFADITGCLIRTSAPIIATNIDMEISVSPSHTGAAVSATGHGVLFSNFRIYGNTGTSQDGVLISGTDCRFSDGFIDVGHATPITISGTFNVITGVRVDCGNVASIISGNDNQVSGCTFDLALNNAINIEGDDNWIFNNRFISCATSINLIAGATDNIVYPNSYRGIYTDTIDDSGDGTGLGLRAFRELTVDQENFGNVEIDVIGMTEINFPLPPNGLRRFRVSVWMAMNTSFTASVDLILNWGLTGTKADAAAETVALASTTLSFPDWHRMKISNLVITPTAGQMMGVSVNSSRTDSDLIKNGRRQNTGFPDQAHSFLVCEYLDG